MKKLVLSILALGLAAGSANAATLMKAKEGQYGTRLAAAKAAAAYKAHKAQPWTKVGAHSFAKVSAAAVAGTKQQITVKAPGFTFAVTTVRRGTKDYTAYVPNRSVFTPINAGK